MIFEIDFKDNTFVSHIPKDEEYDDHADFYRQFHIYWNKGEYGFKIPISKIDEMIQWFIYHKHEYTLFRTAHIKINEMKQEWIELEIKYSRSRRINKDLFTDKYREFSFHKEAFTWRERRSSYLDSYSPGLGKTSMTIFQFTTLFNNDEIDGCLIVVPIGMSYHWKTEILGFVKYFTEDDILILDNKNKKKPFNDNQDKKIILIPENIFKDVILSYKKDWKGGSTKKLQWKKYIDIKKEWNKKSLCLVADESHLYRNPNSIRTKALLSVKDDLDFRYLLSATPSINKIENIYSQIHFIDKSIIPMSYNAFRIWLADEIGDRFDMYTIKQYNVSRVAQVKEAYKSVVTQLLKEDIPELKVKQFTNKLKVDFSKKQRALYDLIINEELMAITDEYDKVSWKLIMNAFPFLIQIIDNPELLKKHTFKDDRINKLLNSWNMENDDNKFILLKSKLSNLIEEQGKKVIVYDTHPLTLDTFFEKFKKYNPLIIHGEIKHKNKDKERQNIIDKFNNDDNCKLILLSSLTSSAGINLQSGSDHIIISSEPMDSTLLRQLMDRTHRVNSVRDSYVETIINENSIDNIRYNRNRNRVAYNNQLTNEVSESDLRLLLNGQLSA